jgi:mannitol 2-dehydrogenase
MTTRASTLVPLANAYASGGTATATAPSYDRSTVTAGIAHIGVGNFHRVHQGIYLDDLLSARDDHNEWGIVGIGLRSADTSIAKARAYAYAAQNGLYSVTLYDEAGTQHSRIVGSMVEYIYGPDDPEAAVARLTDPAIRIVSLTITEGGYNLDETTGVFRTEDAEVVADLGGDVPQTVFGVLVEALRRRRDAGIAPFTVMSCDNLRGNGDTARTATVGYARAVSDELAEWIDHNVSFPNSMVDRIAPTVSAETRQRLQDATGLDDGVPALTEEYRQWVLQDEFPTGRPAWEALGVQLRPDVETFEAIKGRLLNASHMLLSYPGALLGYTWVSQAAGDERIAELLRTFMAVDAAPLLDAPHDVDLTGYQSMVVGRFANPNVPDTVLRVAHDGAAKLPVFHRATAEGLIAAGADPRRSAFLLATFRKYIGGVDETGATFEVNEPHLAAADWALLTESDPLAALEAGPFKAWNLTASPVFGDHYRTIVTLLDEHGVGAAIDYALGH